MDNVGSVVAERRVVVPPGLAEMAPGPALSAVLDGIDESHLTGFECVEVAKARYRQLAHEQAKFFAIVAETGLACRPDGLERAETAWEFSAVELSPALGWSQRKAASQVDMAVALTGRLPVVWAALCAGRLDEPKARAFANWTAELTVEQARKIAAGLVPEAPSLTVSELIKKIKAWAVAIDPSWAERRYRAAVAAGLVSGRLLRDGTVEITGRGLPADRAASACARVTDLARRARRAGDRRKITLIRVDIFLGELEGRFTGWSDDQIVDYLVGQGADADVADVPPRQGAPADMGCPGYTDDLPNDPNGDGEDPGRDHGDGDDPDGPGGGDGGPADMPGDDEPGPGGPAGEDGDGDPDGGSPGSDDPGPGAPSGAGGGHGDDGPADMPDGARPGADGPPGAGTGHGVGELRIGLSTLLGMDERPAELAAWGPIGAGLGRVVAEQQRSGQWRFVLLDDGGRPVNAGLLRARPQPLAHGPPQRRSPDAIVEIHVHCALLDRLAADPAINAGRWAPVIGWLAAQPRSRPRLDDGNRRSPRAALRRAVQLRDRFCTFPGCTIPAARSDQDHVRDHADGGRTTEANLVTACRFHHRAKHHGHWQVIALPDEGVTIWVSPLAHPYLTRPQPITMVLPEPMPGPADPEPAPNRPIAAHQDRHELRRSILQVGYPVTGEEAEHLADITDQHGHLRPKPPKPQTRPPPTFPDEPPF